MADFPLNFGSQSDPGRGDWPNVGPEHINAYVEEVKEGDPPYPFRVPDGLTAVATISGGGACRGLLDAGSFLYGLFGTKFVKLDQGFSQTDIGGIPGTTGVFLTRNAASPFQIAAVTEGLKYSVSNDDLVEITDTDLPPPESVTFSDQRVIFGIPDGRIFWSAIDDVTDINSLDFATAEGAPDGLTRVFGHKLDVWLFGKRTTEIWRATTSSTNPYQRVSGGFIRHGCSAHHSVANIGDVVLWVTDNDQVVAAAGYAPQVISNNSVSRDIKSVSDKDSITAFTHYSSNQAFYTLTCPAWTWQLNFTTGKWFSRKSYGQSNWRAKYSAHFGNDWIVGDATSNVLYKVDPAAYSENSNLMVMTLRSPPVHAYPHRVSIDRLHLDFTTGVGLNSTDSDESNPQVGMRYSEDGGRSWSKQLLRSLGVDGDHRTRVSYDGLGVTGHHGRIFEIQASAPVVRGLLHAAIEGDLIGA